MATTNDKLDFHGSTYELRLKLSWEQTPDLEVRVRRSSDGSRYAGVAVRESEIVVDRSHLDEPSDGHHVTSASPFDSTVGSVELRVLVHHTTLEVFVDDGRHVHSHQIFPAADQTGIALVSDQGVTSVSEVIISELAGPALNSQR